MRPKAFRGRTKIRTGDLRAIRREKSFMYGAWVRGEITNDDYRAGSLGLDRMARLDAGSLLEQRVAVVEQLLLETQQAEVRGNGHDHRGLPA